MFVFNMHTQLDVLYRQRPILVFYITIRDFQLSNLIHIFFLVENNDKR